MPGRAKRYGYINAKIRARLAQLFSQKEFSALMKKESLEEAIELLLSTPYRTEVSHYMKTGDVQAVEFALYVHEIETVRELRNYLSGEAAAFVETLLLRYETDMVKNALRLWFDRTIRGRSIAGETEYLYREPLVHTPDLTRLVNAEGEEDMVRALVDTPYRELIIPRIGEVRELEHLFPVELELDRFFYRRLLEQGENLPEMDRSRAERIIGVEIDIQNIDRVVRFVSFFPLKERREWEIFLPGGSISGEVLREAYSKGDAEEAIATLLSHRYTEYRELADGHKSNPYERLQTVERLLYTILNDEVDRLLRGYPFTMGTVIAYIFLKRREIASVVRILNAKFYGFSENAIRELL